MEDCCPGPWRLEYYYAGTVPNKGRISFTQLNEDMSCKANQIDLLVLSYYTLVLREALTNELSFAI